MEGEWAAPPWPWLRVREASSAFNLYLLPRLLSSSWLGHGVGRSEAGNPWGQTAGDGKGHMRLWFVWITPGEARTQQGEVWKWTTWKQPPKIQGKNKNRVVLVYRPFNKGHLQQQWAYPFGKEPPLLPAGFSPQKSPAWCVLSNSSCSGHETPQGNTHGPHSPKFSWQPSAFKC